jgi:hypothetical protein
MEKKISAVLDLRGFSGYRWGKDNEKPAAVKPQWEKIAKEIAWRKKEGVSCCQ